MRTKFGWGNAREKNYMEDLGVDGRKILNACSRNKIRAWTALIWFRKGTNVGCFQRDNESSGYRK